MVVVKAKVLERAPYGVLIASERAGGTAVYANRPLGTIFRAEVPMEEGAIAGATQSLFDRNGEPMPFEESPMGIALRRRRPARAEVQYRVPGEAPKWLDITAGPLDCEQDGDRLAVAYVHDVTHQQQAAAELDEANRQLARQLGDLTWVHRLTERLTGHDSVESTLEQVLKEGGTLLRADMGVARLYDEDHTVMETRAVYGLPPAARELPPGLDAHHLLLDIVPPTGGSLVVEDVETDPACGDRMRELARRTGFRALFALPLTSSDGRPLGVVGWAFARPGRPTARLRQLTDTYCRFAGQIVENNQLYERERRIASTLQESMLAQELPDIPGVQIAACNLPGAQGMQAGGDWYDVIALKDGKVAMALGDVMGKGLGAATAMGQLRTGLRSYALVEGDDPVAVLTDLNALTHDMRLTDMATALYMTVDPAERRAEVVSAGHCPPLLVDHEGARFVRAGQGVPLGVVDRWDADVEPLDLPPGALLILYTDGLVERRGEELGEGMERLRRAALSAPSEVGELCSHLVAACLDDDGHPDDVAILAIRVR